MLLALYNWKLNKEWSSYQKKTMVKVNENSPCVINNCENVIFSACCINLLTCKVLHLFP